MNYDDFISAFKGNLYKDYKSFVVSEKEHTRLCDELWFEHNLEQMLHDTFKIMNNKVVEKIKKHIDTQLNFYNTELDEDDDNYAVGYIGGLKWVKDVLDLMEGE